MRRPLCRRCSVKTIKVRPDRLFSGAAATAFGLFPTLAAAQGTGMGGGMGHTMGGMWLMGLIGILVIVVLVLIAAALIKYLLKK